MQASEAEARLKTTRYFDEQVLRKRPYIRAEWCERALTAPIERVIQDDDRLRFWIAVRLPGEDRDRHLRVVVLPDGETVHDAFFDRDFPKARP